MIDWNALRSEYEQGASLRTLAAKYGISKSLIGKKKFQEQWTVPQVDRRVDMPRPVHRVSTDVLILADMLLYQVSQHLQESLPMKDLKSASDVLAACAKVKQTYPQEQETQDGLVIPYIRISAHARMEIRRILMEDEQRKEQIS